MRAIAALEIVMRPSGDASACPASTNGLTRAGPSGLREEQLGPAVLVGPGDPCGREARLEGKLFSLRQNRERPGQANHVPAVVDADRVAARLCLGVAEKDAAAAADVEQTVGGTERERLEHGLPGKRMRVGAAVCLPRLLAV